MPERDRSEPGRLRHAVTYAITGTEPASPTPEPAATPPGTGSSFDVEALIAELGGVAALREVAAQARAAGRGWPYPIPERLRDGLGAAQLYAAVERVRAVIDEPRPTVRRATTPNADDHRLLRDVPPHHGG
jgi:hypothetical protein